MKAVFLVLVFAHFAKGWVAWLAVGVLLFLHLQNAKKTGI